MMIPQTRTAIVHTKAEDAARAARLELKATLTILVDEGTDHERLARSDITFKGEAGKPRDRVKLRFENGALVVVP